MSWLRFFAIGFRDFKYPDTSIASVDVKEGGSMVCVVFEIRSDVFKFCLLMNILVLDLLYSASKF